MTKLRLSHEDTLTIAFVGYRYCWSDALLQFGPEEDYELSDEELEDLILEFEKDTEGGHAYFPMLGPSDLMDKLVKLVRDYYDQI